MVFKQNEEDPMVNGSQFLLDVESIDSPSKLNTATDNDNVENEDNPLSYIGNNADSSDKYPLQEIKLYPKRWVILILFCTYSMSNAYQWIHLNIIGDRTMIYWNESIPKWSNYSQQLAIDWLSMIYMLAYIPLIFPVTALLDKHGLGIVAFLGAGLNCLGAWLKCLAATGSHQFMVLMLGQTICAISQVFILGVPAHLAAVWFGSNEVSTATAMGVFGNQIGVAIGFSLPPLMVPLIGNSSTENGTEVEIIDELGKNFRLMFYGGATFNTFVFLIVLFVFKSAPPTPSSHGQLAVAQCKEDGSYMKSLRRLITNRNFTLLTLTYGLNTGCYYAIGTLLNPIMMPYFKDDTTIGLCGFTMIISGVLGALISGVWLDKTRKYKETTLIIYILSLASMAIFAATLHLAQKWIVFISMFLLGFFMTGYLPVGFEFAAEITFPESEGTSSGLLNFSAQVFGILLTLGMTVIMTTFSVTIANVTLIGFLFLGSVITGFIRADLRRQRAHQEKICFA